MELNFKRTTSMHIKAEFIKKLFRQEINPDLTDKEMIVYCNRLIQYRKGLRKQLGDTETKAKGILDKHKLNAITVDKWLRYSLVPEDVMKNFRLTGTHGLSDSRVLQLNESRIKKKRAELGLLILELGRQSIEDLEKIRFGGN